MLDDVGLVDLDVHDLAEAVDPQHASRDLAPTCATRQYTGHVLARVGRYAALTLLMHVVKIVSALTRFMKIWEQALRVSTAEPGSRYPREVPDSA